MKNNKEVKGSKETRQDPEIGEYRYEEAYKNRLRVPKAVKQEIEANGDVCRWININEFRRNGGYHHNHWRPYKPKAAPGFDEIGSRDAEGLIRRGDLVLAVRSNELNLAHKKHLREKAQRGKRFNQQAADQLRRQMRGARVFEGYEENN